MKKEARTKCSDEFERKVIDDNAETITELCESTGMNRSSMGRISRERIAEGRWEQVWKRSGRKLVAAYRVIR